MPEITVTIGNAVGLHARPAALFVQTAKRYQATISVRLGERQANAKSMVQVLTLAAAYGSRLAIQADGDDADEALLALQRLITADFREEAS